MFASLDEETQIRILSSEVPPGSIVHGPIRRPPIATRPFGSIEPSRKKFSTLVRLDLLDFATPILLVLTTIVAFILLVVSFASPVL